MSSSVAPPSESCPCNTLGAKDLMVEIVEATDSFTETG